MAARATTFWTFIGILLVLHLCLRVAAGLTIIPDLFTVAALLGARRLGGWQAALFGLILGVLADSLSLVGFGATAVAYVVVCYLGSRSRNWFEGDSYLFVLAYAFVGSWLVELIRYAVGGAFARGVAALYLATDALLGALYIALAAVVALVAYRSISGHR